MLKIKKTISFLICMVLISSLIACSADPVKLESSSETSLESSTVSEESSEGKNEVSDQSSLDESSEESTDETLESSDTEEEVLIEIDADTVINAYREYEEFNNFWYAGGASLAAKDEFITYNNMNYCRYETDEIKNFEDFQNKAFSIMSQGLWEELQEKVEYIEQDGALYGPISYGSGDSSAFAGNECEAARIAQGSFELIVDQYYYASAFMEDADQNEKVLRGRNVMLYEKIEEGWRFTSFSHENINSFVG